jgi:hypothetical protein
VNQTDYSKLIGKFVNDSKNQVAASYNWNALSDTLTAVTSANIFSYVLTGSGVRFRMIDAYNDTEDIPLQIIDSVSMNRYFFTGTPEVGAPRYISFNGTDINGDTLVDVYPKPDGVYTLRFNVALPQPDLTSDSTVITVPAEIVEQFAYARALVERGEDGGLPSSEAYQLAKNIMSDYIAIESSRRPEEMQWVAN